MCAHACACMRVSLYVFICVHACMHLWKCMCVYVVPVVVGLFLSVHRLCAEEKNIRIQYIQEFT